MKAKKTHWFRNTLLILIVCGMLGTGLSAFRFFNEPERTFASASIQFTFDGAANGIAPNGNPFDMGGILSDTVINDALKASGLENQYTADQIRAQMNVEGAYPDNIVEQVTEFDSLLDFSANRALTVSQYQPTLYTVKLYNDFDTTISAANLKGLLQNIMSAYKAYFAKVYAVNAGSIEVEYNLGDYDYPQQLSILSQLMNQSRLYAEEMYEIEPSLKSGGYGFNDIAVRLNNLIDNEVARLNANITMDVLTKNPSRLLTQYQFEIRNLSNELDKQTECLAKLDDLIASYDKSEIIYISTNVSLTKIAGNSSETYDQLVAERKAKADEITQINTRINTYKLLLSDLLKDNDTTTEQPADLADGQADSAAVETVELSKEEIDAIAKAAEDASAQKLAALEKEIDTIVEKRKAVMVDFTNLMNAYNSQMINDLTVEILNSRYYAPSLLSGSFVMKVIKTAGPICAVGFMACMVMLIISRGKEQQAKTSASRNHQRK